MFSSDTLQIMFKRRRAGPGQNNDVILGRAALAVNPKLGVLYTTGYAVNGPSVGRNLRDATTILLRKLIQIEELSRAAKLELDRRQSDWPARRAGSCGYRRPRRLRRRPGRRPRRWTGVGPAAGRSEIRH